MEQLVDGIAEGKTVIGLFLLCGSLLAGFVEEQQENHAQRTDDNRKFNVSSLVCHAIGAKSVGQRHQRNGDNHTDDITGSSTEDAHLVAFFQALGAHDKNGAVGDHDRRGNNGRQEHVRQEQVGDLCKAGQALGYGEQCHNGDKCGNGHAQEPRAALALGAFAVVHDFAHDKVGEGVHDFSRQQNVGRRGGCNTDFFGVEVQHCRYKTGHSIQRKLTAAVCQIVCCAHGFLDTHFVHAKWFLCHNDSPSLVCTR